MLLRGPSENVFDQSICRTKEQKTRLQCLARAMPKSATPSAAKNGKVSKEKKRKNLAVLAKTPRLKRFFSSNAFKQRCQNSGVNQSIWKCRWKSRHTFWSIFHTQTDWPYWHVIFPVFLFVVSGFCLLFGWILFLAESLSSPGVPNLGYICLPQGVHLLYSRNKLSLRHKI